MDDAQKRIRWVTIAVLAGIALLLSYLDSSGNLGGALAVIRDPLTAVAGFTSTRTDSATDLLSGPRDIQTAREEIAQLEAKIDSLERENEELREDQGELQVLQGLFNRARQSPEFSRQIATVIGYDTSPAVRSIIIDKGSADGITVGMPVEGSRGLVGRVFRTAPNSAQVALITDNASAIPARLGNTRATGVLSGSGLGGPLTMDWIDLKFNIEVGEVVLTSGLGGNFPQDIVVGQVIEVDRSEADLFQQAVIQPATDFDTLEMVFVITDFKPIDTSIFDSPLE
jgi:rod shape-determining protein MreC